MPAGGITWGRPRGEVLFRYMGRESQCSGWFTIHGQSLLALVISVFKFSSGSMGGSGEQACLYKCFSFLFGDITSQGRKERREGGRPRDLAAQHSVLAFIQRTYSCGNVSNLCNVHDSLGALLMYRPCRWNLTSRKTILHEILKAVMTT